jgi:DNA-binding MarR family transcriptional regulator
VSTDTTLRTSPADSSRAPSGADQPASTDEDLFRDCRITAVGLLAEVHAGLMARFGAQLASHGLGIAEFDVLIRLSRSPRCSLRMSDLAAQTSLTTSGITRLVDRLERSGLLRRVACSSDRRGLFAELTPAGRQRMTEALPGHLDLIETWLVNQLTPTELEQLQYGLRKLRAAVRPDATAGSEDPAPF